MAVLKQQIYEAIRHGVQKALILPDEMVDDVSVKFRHKTISNDFIPYELQTVDLGLSVKWCKYNLGAFPGSKPEDWYGGYYAWGEMETKSVYNWNTYAWANADGKIITKYNNTDNKTILEPTDDVVSNKSEGKLRIPTKAELEELKDLPNEWIENYNGIPGLNGRIFTGHNGNTLFIPATGHSFGTSFYDTGISCELQSNILSSEYPLVFACSLYFNDYKINTYLSSRRDGLIVRGVYS